MASTIGEVTNPLLGGTASALGEALLEEVWLTPLGRRGFHFFRGAMWGWRGGKWERLERADVLREVAQWIKGAHYLAGGKDSAIKRVGVTRSLVEDVGWFLELNSRVPYQKMPVWLGEPGEGPEDVEQVIAFEDVLVDVKRSAREGRVVTMVRDERWFDTVVIPCRWDETALCPVWDRVTGEWGGGDPVWKERLEREMGYTLMAWRELGRWFPHYGRVRSGKGVIEAVRRAMVGAQAYFSADGVTLSEKFEKTKLAYARVVLMTEMGQLDTRSGEVVASDVKRIVGRDVMSLCVKNKPDPIEVVSPAAVVAHANEVPKLPNRGAGLSSKMVLLPFEHSWLGKEDLDLEKKLMAELPGIARKVTEAAMRLVAEPDVRLKFLELATAKEAEEEFEIHNNAADVFLNWGCVRSPAGKVEFGLLWARYVRFCRDHRQAAVSKLRFGRWLVEESSWAVRKSKRGDGTWFVGVGLKAECGDGEGSVGGGGEGEEE